MTTKLQRCAWLSVAAIAGMACRTGEPSELDTDGESADTGGPSDPATDDAVGGDESTDVGADDGTDDGTDDGDPGNGPSGSVDILFIVDNSGSMGQEQGLLAQSFDALTTPLMDAGISFRIGVTTTDNGNPWCPGTSPEAGSLVLSSCRERLDEFVFEGTTTVDVSQEGCLEVCGSQTLSVTPTPTELDPAPAVRPWIEYVDAANNNIPGASVAEVASCALPMGINGCGFEQPLEVLRKVLSTAALPSDPSYGFIRSSANLLVVFVTDEADCSYNSDHVLAFMPEGNRVFWSLPEQNFPTSAVCWNAGVACSGSPTEYDECHSVSLDVHGNPTSTEQAVMRPVERYVEQLEQLQAAKTAGEVRVMGFVGRSSDDGPFVYAQGTDEAFRDDYGIGVGCTGSDAGTRAVPPVRLREVANAINPQSDEGLFSVCSGNYAPALSAMANEIISWAP